MEQTPERSPQNSEEAFQQKYRQVCDLMLRINGKLYHQAHDQEPKDWADVGNLDHTVAELEELATFLDA